MWECPHPEPCVFVGKQCCACIATWLRNIVRILLDTLKLALLSLCALQQQLVSEGVHLTLCIPKKGPCWPCICHFAALLIYACLHVVCFGLLHREPCNANARASHNICCHARSMTQQKTSTKELPWTVMEIKLKEISRRQKRWGEVDVKTVVVFWWQGMEQESTVDVPKNKIEDSPKSGMWYLIKVARMMWFFS